jgi:AcrR family transcriptional regulator
MQAVRLPSSPVSALEPVPATRLRPAPRSAAQARVISAAVDLFGRRGVSGTSLQMIADAIGVTKAAVYHQFKTKEEIVIAVLEDDLGPLESALDAAEAEAGRPRAREVLLELVIDSVVRRRRIVSALQQDPVIVRLLARHEPFLTLMDRLFSVLTGGDTSPAARVRGAMISAAIGGAVMHPLVVDLDDETLRSQMLEFARQIFELRD